MTVTAIRDNRDLTSIPHPKCECGHTDDMHYANSDEAAGVQGQAGSRVLNFGFGCKMEKRGKQCACHKYVHAS